MNIKSYCKKSNIYELSNSEKSTIEFLISKLMEISNTVESNEIALTCELAACSLPEKLLQYLKYIAAGDISCGYVKIAGFEVDDISIGPSPEHWDQPWSNQLYLREEFFQMLISSAIGGVFGWRTQENGRFLRHIVPIENVKNEQLGGSSSSTLLWHTEEAFHPGRADFFTLMCYRNNEKATTNIACVEDLELSSEIWSVLRQPRFIIAPDKSHTPSENKSTQWNIAHDKFIKIQEMLDQPIPVPLIYGQTDSPMMRIDQAFAKAVKDDGVAECCLRKLHEELDRVGQSIILMPGDLVILDNVCAAHGRSIYSPHYGPKQRWMRRVNISNGRRNYSNFRDPQNTRIML